jgi:hypothetical protein
MSGAFADHLSPGIMLVAGTELKRRNGRRYWPMFWQTTTSQRQFEDVLYAAGLPIAPEKPEGQAILAYDPLEGNTKRIFHDEWGIGFQVTQNAWEDDLMATKGSALRAAAAGIPDALIERQEIQGHEIFNTPGFDGTITTLPDSSAFFAASHLPVAGGEAPAQPNRFSPDVALSLSAFRNAEIAFMNYVNDRGLRIPDYFTINRLITAPANKHLALELMRSPTRPDQDNPAFPNVTQGGAIPVVTPYIVTSTHWFLQATLHHLLMLWRRTPAYDSFDDRNRRIATFVGFQRMSFFPYFYGGMWGSVGV